MRRYALLRGARSRREVEAYLPTGYEVIYEEEGAFVIAGRDDAGWTLNGYVLPRLASGLIFGEEIDTDHEIMPRLAETVVLAAREEGRRDGTD